MPKVPGESTKTYSEKDGDSKPDTEQTVYNDRSAGWPAGREKSETETFNPSTGKLESKE